MVVVVGFLVVLLSVLPVQAKTEKYPNHVQYRIEYQYEDKIDSVSKVIAEVAQGLGMQVIPGSVIMPLIPIHIFASDEKMQKQIYVYVGAKVDQQHFLKTYEVEGLIVHHFSASGVPLAIAFNKIDESQMQKVLNRLKSAKLDKVAQAPVLSLLIPQAHADEEVQNRVASSDTANQEPGLTDKLIDVSKGCAMGLVSGAHSVVVDPFIQFGKGVYYGITDTAQTWANTKNTAARIGDAIMSPVETAKAAYKARMKMTNEEGAKSNCSLAGGGMAGGYMYKTARGVMEIRGGVPAASQVAQATIVDQEMAAIKAAEKLGFKTGNRAKVLKAIDAEVEKFIEYPYSMLHPDRFRFPDVEGIRRYVNQVKKNFKPSNKDLSPEQYQKELAVYFREQVLRRRNSGDSDLLQIVRRSVENEFSWSEFYDAWYHRTVSSGSSSALHGGTGGNLSFLPGPTPGSVQVFGFSHDADPKKVLAALSNKPLNIESVKIQSVRRTEGVTAYPLEFSAIITP